VGPHFDKEQEGQKRPSRDVFISSCMHRHSSHRQCRRRQTNLQIKSPRSDFLKIFSELKSAHINFT